MPANRGLYCPLSGTEERKRRALVANEAEILIVEDDEVIMGTLAYNLSRNGFGVSQATTGAEALRMARKLRPDLILLDIMLPEESGIEVCERIRERDQGVMIVMITAKDAEEDKVRGFEAGADDYVTKPFGMKELVARINANLKRGETGGRGKLIEAGDLQLDTKNFTARAGDEPLDLRLKEFELLAALASTPEDPRRRGGRRAAGPAPQGVRAPGGACLHAGGAQEPRGARERGLGTRGRRF